MHFVADSGTNSSQKLVHPNRAWLRGDVLPLHTLQAWHIVLFAGAFQFIGSLVGICGLKASGSSLGMALHGYLLCLVVTLLLFVGIFFAAAFYASRA